MHDGWRQLEQQHLLDDRRRVAWLCAGFGSLTTGGFLVASLPAMVLGAIGATAVIGQLHNLRAAQRLLSRE